MIFIIQLLMPNERQCDSVHPAAAGGLGVLSSHIRPLLGTHVHSAGSVSSCVVPGCGAGICPLRLIVAGYLFICEFRSRIAS